jgi:hypothetical protein
MFAVATGLCALAFLSAFLAGRRSLAWGLCAAFFWGYFYGILRANVLNAMSHFIFDSALVGCYASLLFQKVNRATLLRSKPLGDWVAVLIAWTLLIALIPFQTPLVTLVGLRGNLFFIPVLLLATRVDSHQLRQIILFLAGMNLVALSFGIAEYFQGIERYYPVSEVTAIIYRSHDVAGGYYRIPAIFANAHAYAGTMVATMPFMLGLTGIATAAKWQRLLALAGFIAGLFGVLFSNTRTNFIATVLILLAFLLLGKMRPGIKAAIVFIIIIVGLVASTNPRFSGRFQSLEKTEDITGRLAGSVNRSFLEVITDYPLGNGLGGGGTSVPHFLAHQVRRAIAVENEYARIALELGFPGLLLWIGFLSWILIRGAQPHKNDIWLTARRLMLFYLCINFGLAVLGTGMLTAIPATMLSLFNAGWLITKPLPEDLLPLESSRRMRMAQPNAASLARPGLS